MTEALHELINTWGLSNSEIARALYTTTSVIRAWRNGTEPNSDEVARADTLNSFLTDVHARGVPEPAAWMSEPLADGYTATRWKLYVAGCSLELMRENARGEISNADLLHEFNPDWRRTYWTSSTTFVAEDGHLSIREKTYDEVREQIG